VRFRFRFPALRRWGLDEKETTGLAVVLLLVFAAYSRSLLDGFVFDDFPQIVFNHPLRHWSFVWLSWTHEHWWFSGPSKGPHAPYYRPVQNTFLALAFPIAGTNPLIWHLVKITLHLTVVALAFRFSQLLTANTAASLLAALLFGVITVHAEPVVWISAYHEPLTAIFELGAFCTFISRSRGRPSGLLLPLLLFALAAFAHESAVVFPALIAAYVFLIDSDIDADRSGHDSRHKFACLRSRFAQAFLLGALFAVIDLLYMGARFFVLGRGAFLGISRKAAKFYLVGNRILIRESVVNAPAPQILYTVPLAIATYLEVFVMPWLAGPTHPVRLVTTRGLENFYRPLGALLLLALFGYSLLHRKIYAKLYLFCVIWWFINLLPALDLNQVVSLVQDRYEYIPSIGLCILAGDLSVRLATNGARWQRVIALGLSGFVAVQLVALWRIEAVWHDNQTLFTRCLEILPDSIFYREQLAAVLRSRGDLAGTAKQLTIAAESNPDNYSIHSQLVELYTQMGRKADADQEFRAYLRSIAPWSLGAGSRKPTRPPRHD